MTAQNELIPMLPGDLLRHKREQAGLTLGRASELSHIKPAVLAAIESGETAAFPSVYLKGYVRNYARFLGVDSASIEQSLQHLRGSEPLVQSVFTVPSARGRTENHKSEHIEQPQVPGPRQGQAQGAEKRDTPHERRMGPLPHGHMVA